MIKNKDPHNVLAIIPVRYGSTRFPGKPLAQIMGKSLVQRTYENAKHCKLLNRIVIATDDTRIYDHVAAFGGEVVMTSESCLTGTDRVMEAMIGCEADLILNIQGDEPCLEPQVMEKVIQALVDDPEAVMSTAITRIQTEEEALNKSVVKCVIDRQGYALYFSRALIPCGKTGEFRKELSYFKHLGIYAYRCEFLPVYARMEPTQLQLAEDLEQLKVLEEGYKIKTVVVDSESIGVDAPEDIKKIERWLCKQNSSLSQAESAHP